MLKALTVLKDQNFANIVVGQTLTIPVWSTAGRPSPATDGMIGFNSDLDAPESPVAGNPSPAIPLVPGAVEILRFGEEVYFSGLAAAATTLYITPGQGL
jgi:hypothetical protein